MLHSTRVALWPFAIVLLFVCASVSVNADGDLEPEQVRVLSNGLDLTTCKDIKLKEPKKTISSFKVKHAHEQGWACKVASNNPRSPAVRKGLVVVGSGSGNDVFGIDIDNGKQKWRYKSQDSGISSVVVDDRAAYFTTYSCTLERVTLTGGRRSYAQYLASTVHTHPVLAGDTVYATYPVGDSEELAAYSAKTGNKKWSTKLPGRPISGPVISGDKIVVATTKGTLCSFERTKGEMLWQRDVGAVIAPVPTKSGLVLMTQESDFPSDNAEKLSKPAQKGTEQKQAQEAKELIPPHERSASSQIGEALLLHNKHRLGLISDLDKPGAGDNIPEPSDGALRYSLDYQGERPSVSGNNLVSALAKRITFMNIKKHKTQWTVIPQWNKEIANDEGSGGRGQFVAPVIANGRVFLASDRGHVLALDQASGQMIWGYRFYQCSFVAQPVLDSGRLLLTTKSGLLLGFPTGDVTDTGWKDATFQDLDASVSMISKNRKRVSSAKLYKSFTGLAAPVFGDDGDFKRDEETNTETHALRREDDV